MDTVNLRPQNAFETVVADMNNERMTGKEKYPILGQLLLVSEAEVLMSRCAGLHTSADCLEKASVVIQNQHLLSLIPKESKLRLCLGAIRVLSTDGMSAYGHAFVPPNELHAWVEVDNMIMDISLPGVIIRGMNCRDQIGIVLTGRFPLILAGKVPDWIWYKAARRYGIRR